MINTSRYEPNIEFFVLPTQCEQVFYSQVQGREGRSFVVRFDPRRRHVKYIFPEEYVHEEEEDTREKGEVYSKKEGNQVDHIFILSNPIDDLHINIPYVMDNHFNDYEVLDRNSDLDESNTELDEVKDQYDRNM